MSAPRQWSAVGPGVIGAILLVAACVAPSAGNGPASVANAPSPPGSPPATSVQHRLIDAGLTAGAVGWAVTDAGLEVSTDRAQTWSAVRPIGVDSGAIVAVDIGTWPVGHLLVRDGSGGLRVLGTTDSGRTWTDGQIPDTFPDGIGGASMDFVDGLNGYVEITLPSSSAASIGELMRTTDGGASWTRSDIPVDGPILFVSPNEGWVAGGPLDGQLFRTVDGGATWLSVSVDLPPAAGRHRPAFGLPVLVAGRLVLPVRFVANDDGPLLAGFYESDNGGTTWSLAAPPVTLADEGTQAAIGVAAKHWMAASTNAAGFLTSADDGRTFTSSVSTGPHPEDVTGLDVLADGTAWAIETSTKCQTFKTDCSTTRSLWVSTDNGKTWSRVNP